MTGTGTEVGKTVVAAVIAHTLAASGERVAVFKPAVTGLNETVDGPKTSISRTVSSHRREGLVDRPETSDIRTESTRRRGIEADHELLRRAARSQQSDEEIAPYRYGPPASPHLAAEIAGEAIDPKRLLEAARTAAGNADALVCEGVGGLLVPLAGRVCVAMGDKVASQPSERYLVRDLAVDLGFPLVIAAPPTLGTINHTLLTIEAARAAGLQVAAIVLTPWPESPSRIEESNRETIAALGEVRVEALPQLDLDDPSSWPSDWRLVRHIAEQVARDSAGRLSSG